MVLKSGKIVYKLLMNSIEKIHVGAARFIFYLKKSTPGLTVPHTGNWNPIYVIELQCNGLTSNVKIQIRFY